MTRIDGRSADQLRTVRLTRGWLDHAAGSLLAVKVDPGDRLQVLGVVGGEVEPEIAADAVRCTEGAHGQAHLIWRGHGIGTSRVRQAAGSGPDRSPVAWDGDVAGR